MDTEVWFFFPRSKTALHASFRRTLMSACSARGWKLVAIATDLLRLPPGRVVNVVPGGDATGLYRHAHRAKVAVLSAEPANVCRRPRPEDVRKPGLLIGLERFSRYKAFFVQRFADPLESWIPQFEDWGGAAQCSDELDPRCLPLHVFDSEDEAFGLEQAPERDRFEGRYGAGRKRADDSQTRWELGPFHGFEELHVACTTLPRGFHWDVSRERGRRTLYTTAEEWIVTEYANVGPDASVRATRREFARKVFP